MVNIFTEIINMSITASYIVPLIILLRLLFKKAPKWIMVLLWSFVAIRLLCPFSVESIFSLIPQRDIAPTIVYQNETIGTVYEYPAISQAINGSLTANVGDSVEPMQIIMFAASIIWIIGMAAMLIYSVISFAVIKKRVGEAVLLKDNIWLCDRVATPFILGIIKPRIYIPSSVDKRDFRYVIAHEKAHLKRLDHLWKPIGFLLLCVYWFNPLMWVSYILLCRDIELACDEKVISELGNEVKKPYSEALVNCSVSKNRVSACPLAFGENGIKSRIKSVLSYKRAGIIITAVSLSVVLIVALCFLTNPEMNGEVYNNSDKSSSETEKELNFATSNNVSISAIGFGYSEGKPCITISIKNNCEQNVVLYGQDFYILDGDTVVESNGTVFYDSVQFTLKSGESDFLTLDLQDYTLKDNEVYRLVKNYKIDGNDKTFGGFVEFKIDSREVKGTLLKCVGTTYEDNYSDNAFGSYVPMYLLGEDGILYSEDFNGKGNVIKKWYPIGKLEKFKVGKKDFRATSLVKWYEESESLESIIANNETAFRYVDKQENFYYKVLKQKDGSYYLIEGWTGNDGIYRVIKMSTVTSEPLAVDKVCLTTVASKTSEETDEFISDATEIGKYLKGDHWTEVSENRWVKCNPSRPSSKFITVQFKDTTYIMLNLYFSESTDTAYASFFRGKGGVMHYTSLTKNDYTRVILSDEFKNYIIENILN